MLDSKESLSCVIERLKTDEVEGLNQYEVEKRLELYGINKRVLTDKSKILFQKSSHLIDFPMIILLVLGKVYAYIAYITGSEWLNVWLIIISIIIINIFLNFYQKNKVSRALETLKKLNVYRTTVIRDGLKQKIDINLLVPGDIIEIGVGDRVPADARLIESSSLQVEDSNFHGKSIPTKKEVVQILEDDSLGSPMNMIYSESLVTNGRAKAVVVKTMLDSGVRKFTECMSEDETNQITPIRKSLKKLKNYLCFISILSGVIIILINMIIKGEISTEILQMAVSLVVAVTPTALSVSVTLILSQSLYNMIKKKIIIYQASATEIIRNTSVICSDKTGTLTQDKMQIKQMWHVNCSPVSVNESFNKNEMDLIELLASCSNATIEIDGDNEKIVGDPTEVAIIRLLISKARSRSAIEKKYPRVYELPFEPTRKLMTTVHQHKGGYLVITKGAFDRIPVSFDEDLLEKATRVHDFFAEQALRVIAVAYKKYDQIPENLSIEALENDMVFLGMCGMFNPPRPESKEAVERARSAGIKTVMITGDHVLTAKAIAKEIGIFQEGDHVITEDNLAMMSEEELKRNIHTFSVYSRVSPEDKIRIIQAWQSQNEVIIMTGDGVNDALALKAADVGIAMGIAGSDIAKNASDMVIANDNFAMIIDAISEGRLAYDNVKKMIYFLLNISLAQIFIVIIGLILGWGIPLATIHLLLISLILNGIPACFLISKNPQNEIMKKKPLSKNEKILTNKLLYSTMYRSILFVILTLFSYYMGSFIMLDNTITPQYAVGRSMAFIVLLCISIINLFNIHSEKSILKLNPLSDKKILIIAVISITIITTILRFSDVFEVMTLSLAHWGIIAILTLCYLVLSDIQWLRN